MKIFHIIVFLIYLFLGKSNCEEVNDSPLSTCHFRIPKIIHFVYHDWHNINDDGDSMLPKSYLPEWRNSFKKYLNDSWTIKLWNAKTSRNFILEKFPKYINMYDNYPLPIQRVDAIRYFLLKYYGGIYADLDYELLKDITPLLCNISIGFSLRDINNLLIGGIQNSLMISIPQHPFWDELIDELLFRSQMPLPPKGAHGDFIMLTTGPTFISQMLMNSKYLNNNNNNINEEVNNDLSITLLSSNDVFPFNFEDYSKVTDEAIHQVEVSTSSSSIAHSCRDGVKHVSEVAKKKGAYAIHHFIGAWTALGPRCSFTD